MNGQTKEQPFLLKDEKKKKQKKNGVWKAVICYKILLGECRPELSR